MTFTVFAVALFDSGITAFAGGFSTGAPVFLATGNFDCFGGTGFGRTWFFVPGFSSPGLLGDVSGFSTAETGAVTKAAPLLKDDKSRGPRFIFICWTMLALSMLLDDRIVPRLWRSSFVFSAS